MYHHDNRPYEVAVSEASKKFQTKIEDMIHTSVPRVQRVIEQVQNDVPEDMVVKGKTIRFDTKALEDAIRETDNLGNLAGVIAATEKRTDTEIKMLAADKAFSLHKHALYQVCDRANIKNLVTVVRELSDKGEWGKNLAANALSEIYSHFNGDRFLIRSVRDQVRGFLSDQFRRLDSRPLLDAFVGALAKYGARPVDGFALDTKVNIRAILPYVFEPFPGEIMAFGAQLSDSDFGDGALSVSGFVIRMWCSNLATTEDVLKQIHLGRRLSDSVQFSDRTLQLDTDTMASAVKDVAGHVLGAGAVNNYLDLVKQANEAKIEPTAIQGWVKKNLTKAESVKAVDKFNSPDVEMLPAGQTKWRWSNALSWLANETEDEHRKLELQEFAGGILK